MAGTYQGYNPVVVDRILTSTIPDHIRKLEDAHMRKYAFPAQLQAAGRVVMNCGGNGFDWPVRYKRRPTTHATGTEVRTYTATNLNKKAELAWRGYETRDIISALELDMNKGEAAIVNLMDNFANSLKQDLDDNLARQYFADGTTNTRDWTGLETMFATSGTVSTAATPPSTDSRAVNQGDIVGYPSGTYANIHTDLQYYGGSQYDGIWPAGDQDPQVDFWTPLVLFGDSSNSTAYSATTHDWFHQCEELIGYAVTNTGRLAGASGLPTTCLLDRGMYNELKNGMRSRQGIEISRGEGDFSLVRFGFKDVIVVDGVEVTFDNCLPVDTGYMYSYQNIELRSLRESLLVVEGPLYDMDLQGHKCAVFTRSNLKFESPRNFFKIVKSYSQLS